MQVKGLKNLNQNNKPLPKRQSYMGIGIAPGFGIGAVLGSVTVYTLLGRPVCMLSGILLGLMVDLLFQKEGYLTFGGWFGIAAGLVIGTVLDVHRKRGKEKNHVIEA